MKKIDIDKALMWQASRDWQKINCIDAHTAGEPLRIILDGFPDLPGDTILEKRRYAKDNYDHLRKALMWEPRGHADMYGCIIVPPVTDQADFGVLFIHNEGFSTMCGHGIIGVTEVALQTGMIEMKPPLTTINIDTPAGLVTAHAESDSDEMLSISFENVPSFVAELDVHVDVPGIGKVRYDLAYGGAWYAYVQAQDVGLNCVENEYYQLIEAGMAIKQAVMASREIKHPFEEDINFLYGTIFIAPPQDANNHSRNVCIFAEGEVDRSPTGTGVSGRAAIHYARKEIDIGESITIESIIGSTFKVSVQRQQDFGPYQAIIPKVGGSACITGRNELLIDPQDSFGKGFILR